MSEDVSTGQPTSVFRSVLADASTATVTCTNESLLASTVAAVEELGDDAPSSLRLLASQRVAKRAKKDFATATTLVDLQEADVVSLRAAPDDALAEPVVVTDDSLAAVLNGLPDRTVASRVADDEVRDDYAEALDRQWEEASEYDLETFARSDFLASLEDTFGETFRDDFERASAVPGTRGPRESFDPVDLLIVLAAKHGTQSYELNRWGESFGVASVGKFSQSKRKLEEVGLVDTEKVHSGSVGRPRQRLVVGQDRLSDAEPEELVECMQSVLS